jgi:hypothetical protein
MGTLHAAMLADGAQLLYKFDEASGNILNTGTSAGSYDFTQVSSNITRQIAGRSGPDALAIQCSATNGSSPTYGHAQGTHPSLSGNKTFSLECVLRCPTTHSGDIVCMDTGDGFTSIDLSIDAGGNNLRMGIGQTGGAFNSQVLKNGEGNVNDAYHHVVCTWDGARWKGYWDGTLTVNVLIGSGNDTIYNPVSTKLAVGGFVDDGTLNTAAKLDVLGIYTAHVLTAGEVTTHYGLIDTLSNPWFYNHYILDRRRD